MTGGCLHLVGHNDDYIWRGHIGCPYLRNIAFYGRLYVIVIRLGNPFYNPCSHPIFRAAVSVAFLTGIGNRTNHYTRSDRQTTSITKRRVAANQHR